MKVSLPTRQHYKYTLIYCDDEYTNMTTALYLCYSYTLRLPSPSPSLTIIPTSLQTGMHCDFACLLYGKLVNKLPQETIYKIVQDAVDIECK